MRISDWSSDVCSSDLFEVTCLAIDGVNLNERKGTNRGALNATASNPALAIHVPLAFIDLESEPRSEVVAHLAGLLLRLPRPERLRAIVTDYGKEDRAIVAEALELARQSCPALELGSASWRERGCQYV